MSNPALLVQSTGTADGHIGTADPRTPETSQNLALWEILTGTADGSTGTSGALYRNCQWLYRHFRSSFPRDPKLDLLGKVISEVPIGVSALPTEWEKGRNMLSVLGKRKKQVKCFRIGILSTSLRQCVRFASLFAVRHT